MFSHSNIPCYIKNLKCYSARLEAIFLLKKHGVLYTAKEASVHVVSIEEIIEALNEYKKKHQIK